MNKLHRKDFSIAVKKGTDANKSKFGKEAEQGEMYYATDSRSLYIANTPAGAIDSVLTRYDFTHPFNIDSDTEANILASSPTAPSGYATKMFGSDTGNFYIYDGAWYIYNKEPFSKYSVTLDGTDDLIETNYRPANLSLSTISWCCWIKNANGIGHPNSTGALGFAYGTHSSLNGPTCVTSGNNGNSFLVGWGGGYSTGWAPSEFGGVGGALDILDGEWHHFAITINGTSIKIYKDGGDAAINSSNPTNNQGIPFGTKTATSALGTGGSYGNFNYFTIGGYDDTSNDLYAYRFSGGIDEFASWERELSGAEISKIYNHGSEILKANPHLYYRMGDNDGGAGTTITDQGSGGNNGTLVNGPTFSTDTPG